MHLVRSILNGMLAACLVALLAQSVASQRKKMNLYSPIDISNAPYTMQLRDDKGNFLCSGVLLANQFVVTAAECFDKNDFTKVVVIGGAQTLTDDGVLRKIAKISVHPDYVSKRPSNKSNVAVLKLKEPLELVEPGENGIVSIPMCEEAVKEYDFVHVVGWRHMSQTKLEENKLTATFVQVASEDRCLKDFNASPEHGLFCTEGNENENQFCVSDLGGPAVTDAKVCGIAASCLKCSDIDYSNSFVDLYYHRDFLKGAMA